MLACARCILQFFRFPILFVIGTIDAVLFFKSNCTFIYLIIFVILMHEFSIQILIVKYFKPTHDLIVRILIS